MQTYLLIDGNAIMHRAFHALPETLATSDGKPTNAIYGFFSMTNKVITDFRPDYITICFDTPVPTFRKKLLEEYQAKRPKAPDSFKQQVPVIHELVDAAGIHRAQREGYEADDVIGSFVTKLHTIPDIHTLILTGDKDILQLVQDDTKVISPKTGLSTITLYDAAEVEKKMGVPPEQIPDFKALAGDPSDNYHAAKGIGPKTAQKLLREFSTIEDLYERLGDVSDARIRRILEQYKDKVLLLKQIAQIVTDLHIEVSLEQTAFQGFQPALQDKLEELELRSLVKRFFPSKSEEAANKKVEKKEVQSPQDQLGLF